MKWRILLPSALVCSAAFAGAPDRHRSPDGAVEALVATAPARGAGAGESTVRLRTPAGRLLAQTRQTSASGAHGYRVEHAAWTPDSQFFVFSTTSSGGHQAWRFPTYFFARRDGKIHLLDAYVGPVTTPDFVVRSPHLLILLERREGESSRAETPTAIRLGDLRKPRRPARP